MLTKNERIILRDNLLNKLEQCSIIRKQQNSNKYAINGNKILFEQRISNDIELSNLFNNYVSQFRSKEEAIYCLTKVDDSSNHLCPSCNELCAFYSNKKHHDQYRLSCGKIECKEKQATSEAAKEKLRATNLERYGVTNAMQCKEIREKAKQTNLERYGVESPLQNQFIKDKTRATNLERYGVEYVMQSKEVQEKSKQTNLERYGVEYAMQSKEVQEKSKQTNLERYGFECSALNERVKEKAKQTNLERYGVENALQSPEIRKKVKQTNLERYGVENVMQSPIIQEKIKQTNLERHGVEYPMQSKEVQEKSKRSVLEHYGVEYVVQSKEVQDKAKQTNLKRYGVEYATQSQQVKQKTKQTNLERYGVEYATQSQQVKEKIKQANLERYGVENVSQSLEIRKKVKQTNLERYGVEYTTQSNIQNYDTWINNSKFSEFIINRYNEKQMFLRLVDIANYFNVHLGTVKYRAEQLNLLQYFYIQESNLEINFSNFLSSYSKDYIKHCRTILYNEKTNAYREIDFLCENSIGFEINDVSTHNSLDNGSYTYKDKYYHRDKTLLANQYNIRLIHLWEWELRDEKLWNRLSQWILNVLNDNKAKIGARKCIIKEVSLKEEKNFLNKYHLQGYKKSQICLGLYYNDELVELVSFCKPRYNKNYQYELLRLCTKYGYSIIGGAQKLLKYFITNYIPTSIISYCDLSKFTGKVYENMGFKLSYITEPQIIWCNKDMKHFSQTSLNMIGADKLLGTTYGKGTDNAEIVMKHGYIPIYNCGLAVYTIQNIESVV